MRPQRVAVPLVFCLAFAVSACGTGKYDNDPDYDGGFGDGCSTSSARSPNGPVTKAVRDDSLWRDSEAYRAGWKAGYSSCSSGGRGDPSGSDRDVGGR